MWTAPRTLEMLSFGDSTNAAIVSAAQGMFVGRVLPE
jgi:hypothetical protein